MFKIQEPIAVANFVIETAEKNHLDVTNLQLQKTMFFTQGFFLNKYGLPLFDGSFARWQFGPCLKRVYGIFRDYGSSPITDKALNAYFDSNDQFQVREPATIKLDDEDKIALKKVVLGLLHIPARTLWELIKKDKTFADYKELTNDYEAPDYTNRDVVECFKRNKFFLLPKIEMITENANGEYTVEADGYDHTVVLSYVNRSKYRVHEYDNGTIVLIPIGD